MLTVHRDRPAIILATIGTTMRGAVDDIPAIRQIIDELNIGEHYIHADAALSGMILPYVDDPQPFGFDAGINSISISGHKLIGAPLPCGVVVTRKHLVETLGRAVELIGVNDTTLSGSRNALTPLMLWYAINHHGEDVWKKTVRGMLNTAEYAVQRFNKHGISAWRHRNSPTVVFDRPSPEVFDRWQIAPEGDVAHIITMPHVTSTPSTGWWLTAAVPVLNRRRNTTCRQRKPACRLRSNRRSQLTQPRCAASWSWPKTASAPLPRLPAPWSRAE